MDASRFSANATTLRETGVGVWYSSVSSRCGIWRIIGARLVIVYRKLRSLYLLLDMQSSRRDVLRIDPISSNEEAEDAATRRLSQASQDSQTAAEYGHLSLRALLKRIGSP